VFDRPAVLATWPVGTRGPWIDDSMVAQSDDRRTYRYWVGQDAEPQTFPGLPSTLISIEPVAVLS
jgi:hypothetical protein